MYLITGATGIVGTHVLMQLLEKELPIYALYRDEKNIQKVKNTFALYKHSTDNALDEQFQKINWVKGDVTDITSLADAMENCDYVFHCAAIVSFKKSDAKKLRKINVEGTANVVNACLKKGIKKLCHVSSTSAVGNSEKNELITEKNKWKKDEYTSEYGVTKYQAEMEVWRGSEEGLDVVIVNPSIIIGPGDWNTSSAELFQKVWNGLKYYTLGKNAFVDVRDVAQSMNLLLHSDIKNERFLVCSENWTYQQVFQKIALGLAKKPAHIQVKVWFLGLIWRIEAVRSFLFGSAPIVTKETAHSSMASREYDASKVKKALDMDFIPLEKSIADTSKLFLQSKQG